METIAEDTELFNWVTNSELIVLTKTKNIKDCKNIVAVLDKTPKSHCWILPFYYGKNDFSEIESAKLKKSNIHDGQI